MQQVQPNPIPSYATSTAQSNTLVYLYFSILDYYSIVELRHPKISLMLSGKFYLPGQHDAPKIQAQVQGR